MKPQIRDYQQVTCGCCTGNAKTIKAVWGEYETRVDQCVCSIRQDPMRNLPQRICSYHMAVQNARRDELTNALCHIEARAQELSDRGGQVSALECGALAEQARLALIKVQP